MESREFQGKVLKEKIKKFKETVRKSAIRLGVKPPIVRIWECPHQQEDEIAHCHPDTGEICISERRLKESSIDAIINTATHETAHLKHLGHSPSFHSTHQDLKVDSWQPPAGGVMSFSEADLQKPTGKSKPIKPDKKKCNYYQSKKHAKGKLKQCKYCNGYFCKNHIEPHSARLRNFKDYNKFAEIKEQESKNPNTHPCISYVEHLYKKWRKQEDEYSKALAKLVSSKRKSYKEKENYSGDIGSAGRDYLDRVGNAQRLTSEYEEHQKESPSKVIPWVIVAIVLLLLAWQLGYLDNLIIMFKNFWNSLG